MARTRPTLREVAERAGLSVTQTSRALNGHDDVAQKTKEHVQKAATDLGYFPNLEARRLRAPEAKADAIALVLPTGTLQLADPFFSTMLSGIAEAARRHRRELLISTTFDEADELATYGEMIDQNRVDGFILVRTKLNDPRIEQLLEADTPFVSHGHTGPPGRFASVSDADDCVKPVVDHLIDQGHRAIACVAEPEPYALADIRMRSFVAAMSSKGLAVEPEMIVRCDFTEEAGRQSAKELLTKPDRPTAIVALNDLLALGVIKAALEQGLDVPADLSVSGFDNLSFAEHTNPPLTTLARQSADQVGQQLAERLVAAIDGRLEDIAEPHLELSTELILRQSTGPLQAA